MQPTTYYQRHKALITLKLRRTRLTTRGGKVIRGLNKRPYPGACELCTSLGAPVTPSTRLEYHHWIPGMPNLGLWLCYPHHKLAELIDDPLLPLHQSHYVNLKALVERLFNVRINSRSPGSPK